MRADYDTFRSVWAVDGHWSIGNSLKVFATGADNIVAMLEKLRVGKEFFVQFAAQGSIVINGDEAVTAMFMSRGRTMPYGNLLQEPLRRI